ncbi:MAG: hypothetical protein DMG80_03120 [Acidobacteria bacterium]|nr:MAG: hypothetical protein DMG80_03120 [Acidobacteriota bacterium]
MKSSTFLRIASLITFFYFAGHTASIPWTPAVGPGEASVLEAMKAHSFNVLGSNRTYWDLYFGFGVIISGYLLVQAVVLWQLGSLAKREPAQVRAIVASFLVAFIVNAFLSWKYFFVIPLINAILISVCLGLALVFSGRSRATQQIVGHERGEREIQV